MIDQKLMLADGHMMPQQGFGLYKVTNQDDMNQVIQTAWTAGYRLFDTAQMYRNEKMVGQALKEVQANRDELFITTKIAEENQGYDRTRASFEESLDELQLDYVDLLLVHWPLNKYFFET